MKDTKQNLAIKALKDLVASGTRIEEITRFDIMERVKKDHNVLVDPLVAHNVVAYVRSYVKL